MQDINTPNSHDDVSDKLLKTLGVTTAIVAGAVMLAPFVLPLVGVGSSAMAGQALTAMHGTALGNGLAGAINGVINGIPLIGSAIAHNGLIAAAASGIIGFGGVSLGHYLHKKEDGTSSISWGKMIATASLVTSALIAMPSILTALSVGVVYLCSAFSGVALASQAVSFLSKTLGSMGSMNAANFGLGGALASLPHLLTCGASVVPAAMSMSMWNSHPADQQDKVSEVPLSKSTPSPEYNLNYTDGSILANIEVNKPTATGVPCQAQLRLTHAATGLPVTDDQLQLTHTKKIHLLVVDQSLKDYQHVHPMPTDEPGVYAFSFTPKTANKYSVWSDCTLARDERNHRLKSDIPAQHARNIPARINTNSMAVAGDLKFQWSAMDVLTKGEASVVNVTVTDKAGNLVTDLEPVMGAYAHLVGFGADGKTIMHCHPLGAEPVSPDDRAGPQLRFHVEPEAAGATQFYLQVRRNGQDLFAPFGQVIKASSRMAEKFSTTHQHDASHGFAM